jgi:hypothetical protein
MVASALRAAALDNYTFQRAIEHFHSFALGSDLLAALGTLNPLKVHPLDQIRRNRESVLRARLVQRRPHFLQIDFS